MKIALDPAGPVQMELRIPGSKSLTNRALICAALAPGMSRLTHASFSDDTRALSGALNVLGVPVIPFEREGAIVIHSGGSRDSSGHFNLGNAGTAVRFFTSYLCTTRGNFTVDGDERMRERPIAGLVDALRQLGADIRYLQKEGCPPLDIRSSGLKGGKCIVGGETSSQFLSSLLLSAPAAEGDVEIQVLGELASKPYVDITMETMRTFGVTVEQDAYRRFRVSMKEAYQAGEHAIESDGASANYFLGMAAATGGRAKVLGIGSRSRQGELKFVRILERMGCAVKWGDDWIEVQGRPLRGVDVDMNDCPDSAQTLACVALFAKGGTRVRNVRNLRVKETDRIAALVRELGKLGAKVKEEEDGFTVVPAPAYKAVEIDTYRDHRMAMSFAVAALAAPGIVIRDPECVSKSYPDFFEQLAALGVRLRRS